MGPLLIRRGLATLERIDQLGGTAGPYALQAAIASLQAETPLDWPQVAALYGKLARLTRSPVVELNRAVAVAQTGEPGGALVNIRHSCASVGRNSCRWTTRSTIP